MHQHRNIRAALAQRREMHCNHVQAEIQIFSESAIAICGFEVAICRRNHAYIDSNFLIAAHRTNFLLLQHAQQFSLHLERELTNFIQKDRATVRGLKKLGLSANCSSESAFLIAEQLAFNQSWNQQPAIYCNKPAM